MFLFMAFDLYVIKMLGGHKVILIKRFQQKIECLHGSIHLDGYKVIHLALEVKTFIGSLHLQRVPVWGPTIGNLDL
jgi:hypothetical protein